MSLIKPHEREMLARWWADTGRHILAGCLSVLIPAVVVIVLVAGFTIN
jgi:hypothetical protein